MVNVGLLGYGKMGKAIDGLASAHDVNIVWRLGREHSPEQLAECLRSVDVVIEFSRPEAAFANVMACLEAGVPVVSGTTGWLAEMPKAVELCHAREGALLWASNFSIGVNVFFALNRYLAGMMQQLDAYRPAMTEIHHIHKLDAPSGTAISLAQDIMAANTRINHWALAPDAADLPIQSVREGEVPGTHRIRWTSPVDAITIEHEAFSRQGFAAGALVAARWLAGKSGIFTMKDVLGIE